MAYSEELAGRMRNALAAHPEIVERKMFGGMAFMLRGNMCCGTLGDDVMVRVGPDGYEEALGEPHVREIDFTGRPMRGMVHVEASGVTSDEDLAAWIDRGVEFALTLPPK